MTPLQPAAGNGHVEAIKVLGQIGADKEAKTDNGTAFTAARPPTPRTPVRSSSTRSVPSCAGPVGTVMCRTDTRHSVAPACTRASAAASWWLARAAASGVNPSLSA
jgi:hypothetical protein